MSDRWPDTRLGDVACLDEDRVPVDPDAIYRVLGVRRDGGGLFLRPPLEGSGTKASTLTRVREGQLVLRKITAWEAPVAVATLEHDGAYVSSMFPTFTLDSARLLPAYMALICEWPTFWTEMRSRTRGTVLRRKTLDPDGLLDIAIPLPPLLAQRRAVSLIAAVERQGRAVTQCRDAAAMLVAAQRRAFIDESDRRVPLAELASIESRLVDPTLPVFQDLPHIGVERIEAGTGRLIGVRTALEDEVISGKYLVSEHDVVYSKIRPNLRKVALPDSACLCSADAYPLRPKPGVLRRYLAEALLSERFTDEAVKRSGRTKMPKINRRELFTIELPLPELEEQEQISSTLKASATVRDSAEGHLTALRRFRQALLDDLLSGKHEIPDTYDELLETKGA